MNLGNCSFHCINGSELYQFSFVICLTLFVLSNAHFVFISCINKVTFKENPGLNHKMWLWVAGCISELQLN